MHRRTYYTYLGFHSFLIGLFPFFLPVYLVKSGSTIAEVCWFIGFTGVGFCCSLAVWERVGRQYSFRFSLILSFILEITLISCMAAGLSSSFLILLALINGAYNCLFWMTQRILFFMTTDSGNSGRKFGDFQIVVMVLLKAGIFIGGLLLEHTGVAGIVLLSLISFATAIYLLQRINDLPELPSDLQQTAPWQLRELAVFSDSLRSRPIFVIDGVFLYFESYFWLISMFFLVHQNFAQLSILVIVLAVTFSLIFYAIKNRIDTINIQHAYITGVVLYAFSWLLRSRITIQSTGAELYVLLILVTFATSYFRLTFNKRFFDNARATTGYGYIFYKSYVSQLFIGLFFCALATTAAKVTDIQPFMEKSYWLAGATALLYLGYRGSSSMRKAAYPSEESSQPLKCASRE